MKSATLDLLERTRENEPLFLTLLGLDGELYIHRNPVKEKALKHQEALLHTELDLRVIRQRQGVSLEDVAL